MSVALPVCLLSLAALAALRSTWSPCGLSMLSTLTPLAEAGRGRHWRTTAGWFVTGAAVGGTALGLVGALAAGAVRALSLTEAETAALAVGAALLAAGFDAGLLSPRLPHHRRQVNELWLDQFRGWVYGAGFGIQIGAGLATYIMTAGVYLVVVLGALGASPLAALAAGTWFGTLRGLAVLAAAPVRSTDRLVALHAAMDRWAEPVRRIVLGGHVIAAAVLAAWTERPVVAWLAIAGAVALGTTITRARRVVVLPAGGPAARGARDAARRAAPAGR